MAYISDPNDQDKQAPATEQPGAPKSAPMQEPQQDLVSQIASPPKSTTEIKKSTAEVQAPAQNLSTNQMTTTAAPGVKQTPLPTSRVTRGLQDLDATSRMTPAPQNKSKTVVPEYLKGKSGSFTNLRQYQLSNQGAGPATKIAQSILDRQQAAREGLRGVTGRQFENLSEQQIATDAEKIRGGIAAAGQWGESPQSVYNRFLDFKNKAEQGYQGPTSLQEDEQFSDVQGQYQQFQDKAALVNTEEGRRQLLADEFARPNYSAGARRLDQLLLQTDASARQKFEAVNKLAEISGADIPTATKQFDNLVKLAKAGYAFAERQLMNVLAENEVESRDVFTPTEEQIDPVTGLPIVEEVEEVAELTPEELAQRSKMSETLYSEFENRFSDAVANRDKLYTDAQAAAARGVIDPKANPELFKLFAGRDPRPNDTAVQVSPMYREQLKKFLTKEEFNVFDLVSPQEKNRYLELAKLAGLTPDQMTLTEASEVGRMLESPSSVRFDKNAAALEADKVLTQKSTAVANETKNSLSNFLNKKAPTGQTYATGITNVIKNYGSGWAHGSPANIVSKYNTMQSGGPGLGYIVRGTEKDVPVLVDTIKHLNYLKDYVKNNLSSNVPVYIPDYNAIYQSKRNELVKAFNAGNKSKRTANDFLSDKRIQNYLEMEANRATARAIDTALKELSKYLTPEQLRARSSLEQERARIFNL